MSNMKFKSDENLTAAQKLINIGLYNSSVHCAYYGCFQFMKCLLCNKLNLHYDKQDAKSGADTHNYIFSLLLNRIEDRKLKRYFRDEFYKLRKRRNKSDYKTDLLSVDESLSAIQEAKNIIRYLKTSFGIIK